REKLLPLPLPLGKSLRRWPAAYGAPASNVQAYLISTSPIWFTRLLARATLPSRVTSTLRTISPPPGIVQVWNFSVFGSKRTIVFGLASDSLYQMAPLVNAMPYGRDCGPLGDCHSFTSPVARSSRPRKPRPKSE